MKIKNLTDVTGPRMTIPVWRRVSVGPGESVEVPGFLRSDPILKRAEEQGLLSFEDATTSDAAPTLPMEYPETTEPESRPRKKKGK